MTQARRALGASGEDLVVAWYMAGGYQVVARNWRCREGELDLIVRSGRLYVFCEVKSRTTAAFGSPFEAVTAAKRRRIRHLAAKWLDQTTTPAPREIRFDVAGVLDGQVEVRPAAF